MNGLEQQPRQWSHSSREGAGATGPLALAVLLGLCGLSSLGCGNTALEHPGEKPLPSRPHLEDAPAVSAPLEGTWSPAASMAGARLLHTATLLADGRLLTAGGFNRTTELYDPGTGTWSRTADALDTHRAATATRLPDGRVLLAGLGDSGISSELYEPTSATWARTGDLRTPRLYHTATPLPGGRVLVTGGADRESGGAVLSTAELYDPATGTWTPVAPMAAARRDHTATVMGNGQVLVTGGTNASGLRQRSAEVYDPATGTWSATGAMATPRISHTATLLPNGKVLVSGGYNGAGKGNADRLATAEVYDPASGTWSAAGSMFVSRGVHTATLLPGGTVLIAGGAAEYGVPVSISELYTPEP